MKFPRKVRLLSRADFRYVFARPSVTSDRAFRVLRRVNDLDHCRLGMAVSRKVCRKATARNRLKRLIRESFRAHMEKLARRGGYDIVVLPSHEAASMSNGALSESLRDHWTEIGAHRPPA